MRRTRPANSESRRTWFRTSLISRLNSSGEHCPREQTEGEELEGVWKKTGWGVREILGTGWRVRGHMEENKVGG